MREGDVVLDHIGRGETGRAKHEENVVKRLLAHALAAWSTARNRRVTEELRKLAERSGRPLDVLANAALRDYARYENQVCESIERGIADLDAGRGRTTAEVLSYLEAQRRTRSGG